MAESLSPIRAARLPKEIEELFDLCRRIYEQYSNPSAPVSPSDYADRKRRLESEFARLCAHLMAMGISQLASKSAAPAHPSIAMDRQRTASRAVALLFKHERTSPRFAVVGTIQRFFREHPEAGPVELFERLGGAVALSLRNVAKTEVLEGNTLYAFTTHRVNGWLKAQSRFSVRGRWIVVGCDCCGPGSRSVMCRDLVSLGAAPDGAFRPPERIAEDILETLRSLSARGSWLHVSELRQAVYEIYRPQADRAPAGSPPPNPETVCAQNELCRIARSIARESARSYGWKSQHAAETRVAFELAAGDKLQDLILLSDDGDSNYEYLKRHIPSLTAREYESRHKGSFQNFWLVVHGKWKKYHAKS